MMLEKQIEKKVCDHAKTRGMLVYKFTSPNRASVPDRLFVTPEGTTFFIEFKAAGKKPTEAQAREHQRLRNHKVEVFVVDDVEDGKLLIDMMMLPIVRTQ